MGVVSELSQLSEKLIELKAQGKKIVSTNGCFDILHVGHVRFLQAARALGDVLVVGLNSDDSVRRLKGPTRPVIGQADRAEILSALACVDYVCIFEEDTPVEFLKSVRPNVHAKGADYKPADLAETPVVESLGGQVNIIELVPGKSTTSIVRLISGERV
ncbi:MAG: D-glycero-beta-D-manno-heptose 1-phosphate adenylyltransferase [Candidatus Obscuribacterales bacterium]|nr:D-glycero-beta-D-manno-heptose 1-phosphate adenylyltransferase [Candidatus Obscuribacterales bacterium]